MSQPTDQDILSEVQLLLLEPPDGGATFPSGLWTPAEVLSVANEVQQQFLKDTACLLTPAIQATLPSVKRQILPADWIITQDVAWEDADGLIIGVPRGDDVQADFGVPDWESVAQPRPQLWTDASLPTLQLQLMPAPNDVGALWLLYVALGTQLTGLGVPLTVPENATPYVKWGILAVLLGKVGRQLEPEKVEYCQWRYQEGVAGVAALLNGWSHR